MCVCVCVCVCVCFHIKLKIVLSKICEELGIPEPKLSKWKNNHIEPDINDLIMLAKYFKVSIDYLVGLED